MPRLTRDRQDRITPLLTQLQTQYQGSSLVGLGDLLTKTLRDLQASARAGHTPPEGVEEVVLRTESVIASLPSTFGERFVFDTQFLDGLVEDLSQGGARFTPCLVPKPSDFWGHQTVIPTNSKDRRGFVIDVIHTPGDDTLDHIDLRDYPFACHELGHNALFNQGKSFSEAFARVLDEVLSGLQRQVLALQGASKQIALGTLEQIRQFWTPTETHVNWAHEIAVDVIATWACGPAYLAAFQHVLERGDTDPYQLSQDHPPYEARAHAMIDAANRLGWAYYTGGLQTLIDRWPRSIWSAGKNNRYTGCVDSRLLQGSVTAALDSCRELGLPLCTPAMIDAVEAKLRAKTRPDNGIETLLAAWALNGQGDEPAYLEWERSVIRSLLDGLTQ